MQAWSGCSCSKAESSRLLKRPKSERRSLLQARKKARKRRARQEQRAPLQLSNPEDETHCKSFFASAPRQQKSFHANDLPSSRKSTWLERKNLSKFRFSLFAQTVSFPVFHLSARWRIGAPIASDSNFVLEVQIELKISLRACENQSGRVNQCFSTTRKDQIVEKEEPVVGFKIYGRIVLIRTNSNQIVRFGTT
jgi:hypothetical protein